MAQVGHRDAYTKAANQRTPLLRGGRRYGFDLVRELSAADGLLTSEGTIYPLLSRLRREGLVTTTWQESDAGGDDVAVRQVLDRLGPPEDIVAAERDDAGDHQVPTGLPPDPPPPSSPWGVVEVLAVLGLTLGAVVIPLLGPLVGAALAWASSQWTRTEKWIATILAVLPIILLALGASIAVIVASPADDMEPVPVETAPANPGG